MKTSLYYRFDNGCNIWPRTLIRGGSLWQSDSSWNNLLSYRPNRPDTKHCDDWTAWLKSAESTSVVLSIQISSVFVTIELLSSHAKFKSIWKSLYRVKCAAKNCSNILTKMVNFSNLLCLLVSEAKELIVSHPENGDYSRRVSRFTDDQAALITSEHNRFRRFQVKLN